MPILLPSSSGRRFAKKMLSVQGGDSKPLPAGPQILPTGSRKWRPRRAFLGSASGLRTGSELPRPRSPDGFSGPFSKKRKIGFRTRTIDPLGLVLHGVASVQSCTEMLSKAFVQMPSGF